MDNKLKSNDDITSGNKPAPKGTKTREDLKRNADEIENTSINAKNTNNNSTSTDYGENNNNTKNDGTKKAIIMETDTETTIYKDDNKEQAGGTRQADIPTTKDHNNGTENETNNMESNTAITNIVNMSKQGQDWGAHKGNINTGHFMKIKQNNELSRKERNKKENRTKSVSAITSTDSHR